MELLSNALWYYAAISISTSLTGQLTIIKPILDAATEYADNNSLCAPILCHKWVCYIVTFPLMAILSPFYIKQVLFGPSEDVAENWFKKIFDEEE